MTGPLKSWLCGALSVGGLDAWLGRLAGSLRRPWVVGYHTVVANAREMAELMPGLAVTAATLERQLDWIGRRFEVVPLEELWALQARRARTQRPLAAITFDDGYRSVHDLAWPILRRKGMPAALFVTTDRIGGAEAFAHDRLYRALRRTFPEAEAYRRTRCLLRAPGPAGLDAVLRELGEPAEPPAAGQLPATWPMLSELRADGWTIGSHTRSHALLPCASPAALVDETRGAREVLERRLGAPILHFAYPGGAFDRTAIDAVAEAGYGFAYTICAHSDPRRARLTVPRTMLWEGAASDHRGRVVPAILSCHSSGLLELIAGCRADHRGARAHS